MTTINGIEMLACAHCGSKNIEQLTENAFKRKYCKIFCDACGVSTKNYLYLERAIEAWNKRYTPPTQAYDLAKPIMTLTANGVIAAMTHEELIAAIAAGTGCSSDDLAASVSGFVPETGYE